MVNLTPLSLLTLGLISSQALAAPAPAPAATTATRSTSATERFSFAKWVDSIIANPDTALSAQEAWQAYLDSVNSTTTVTSAPTNKRWDSQVDCTNFGGDNQARAADAVICINYLAVAGQVPCKATRKTSTRFTGLSTYVYCLYGTAMVAPVGSGYTDPSRWGTCQGIAQTAGAIMDTCTQPNGMVTGARKVDLSGTKAGVSISRYDGDLA